MRTAETVRHADAARVDGQAAIGQPDEGHVGVAEHRGLFVSSGEYLGPPVERRVDEGDFLVVAGSGMAEQGGAETVDIEGDGQGQAGEVVAELGRELRRRPRHHRVRWVVRHRDQLAVAVASHPYRSVAEVEQTLQRRHRHRSGRDVTGQHDPVDRRAVDLGQDRLQRR